ncbi:hypothetical protein [Desulfobotulus sp.]|uniref:hypothetical protein n=1 Tax=Desulfobotulus sp. TaxID=1940337 RepID=UPI002A362D30|nr:hypothetical protein [Desulfobotulus sp.]MDY0164435.1 hypothetical protein [Desulfobotulus sp.]
MTPPSISIQGRRIASDTPPYIVAELSANHNGSLAPREIPSALLFSIFTPRCFSGP